MAEVTVTPVHTDLPPHQEQMGWSSRTPEFFSANNSAGFSSRFCLIPVPIGAQMWSCAGHHDVRMESPSGHGAKCLIISASLSGPAMGHFPDAMKQLAALLIFPCVRAGRVMQADNFVRHHQ